MKKSKLAAAALLAGMLVLPGCGEKEDSSESGSDEPVVCQHVDENKDHECDLCHENVGEHADHDNDHKCDYCEQKVSEHQYGEVVVTKDPTCTEDGEGYQECSICHDQKPVVIPATGHKEVTLHPAVAPTCTQDGNVAYYTCANEPGVFYQDEACTTRLNSVVDPKTGHSDVTLHPAVSPSCTEDGNVAYYTCANEPGVFFEDETCTIKLDSIVVSKTGHQGVELHPAVSPTCTEDGSVAYYTCANEPGVFYQDEACTTKLDSIVDPRTGHSDVTLHPAVSPSCTEDGNVAYYTCANEPGVFYEDEACTSVLESVVDPAFGHVDINGDHVCDVCEENIPWVESIALDYLTGYIGSGESVTFKANVVAHNGASEEVVWKLGGTGTSKATLVDNEDGTATLTGAEFTGTSSYSVKVSASSAFDESISSAEEPVTIATYGDSKRNQLNGYFGEGKWQTIPYFVSTTFTISNNKLTGKSTGRTIAQMINSFDSQGLWIKESSSESGAHYTFVDGYYSYVLDVSANPSSSGKGMITITKTLNIPEVLQKTFAFIGYDAYGSCDMPITLEITSSDATLTCFASDGTVIKNMKCVVLGENEFKFTEPDEGYYDYYVVVKIEGSDVILEEIGGEYFDSEWWFMTTPTKIEEAVTYSVSVNDSLENGSIKFNSPANVSKIVASTYVEFVVSPASGYEVDEVSISGAEVQLNELFGNKYTFTMPEANIVISATFKEKAGDAFNWDTYSGSFNLSVVEYGMTAVPVTFTFTDGSATYSDYPGYEYPCVVNHEGCSNDNQIHIIDDGVFEIIVEENSGSFILVQQIA